MNFEKLLKREFNVGTKDQQYRIAAGIGIMAIAAAGENGLLMLIGVGVVVLAVMKWCPAYSLSGKSTVQKGDKPPLV